MFFFVILSKQSERAAFQKLAYSYLKPWKFDTMQVKLILNFYAIVVNKNFPKNETLSANFLKNIVESF